MSEVQWLQVNVSGGHKTSQKWRRIFAELRPNFGRIVTCCRAEPSRTFGRIVRPNFGVRRTSVHLYCTVSWHRPTLQVQLTNNFVNKLSVLQILPAVLLRCSLYETHRYTGNKIIICTSVSIAHILTVNFLGIYTPCLKKVPTFKLSVTLSNVNQFSKFLHCWKAYEVCYEIHTLPTSP